MKEQLGQQVVGILVFVDDVMSAGSAEDIERCIRNLNVMEKQKKFTCLWSKENKVHMDGAWLHLVREAEYNGDGGIRDSRRMRV